MTNIVSKSFEGINAFRMNIVYMLFVDKLNNIFESRFTDFSTEYSLEKHMTTSTRIDFVIECDGHKTNGEMRLYMVYTDELLGIDIVFYDKYDNMIGDLDVHITPKETTMTGNVNDIIVCVKNDIDNFISDIHFIYEFTCLELRTKSLVDISREYQYHSAGRLVSDEINLIDFLKGDPNDHVIDLNYSKKIFRIRTATNLASVLIREHLEEGMLSHLYDWNLVKRNHLFYIENCDLQTIGTIAGTDLDYMVEFEGYKIIDIVV